jgi:ABC-2 type transport system permease protein
MGKITRLRAYRAVLSARYRTLLQYRSAAFAGLITQLFWGAIRLMILAAFYAVSTQEQPLSLAMVVSYVWLGQAFLNLLPWQVDSEITLMIRSGAVSYELIRPLNLYSYWFARTLAMKTAPTTLRCVPLIVISAGLLPLAGLADWALAPPPAPSPRPRWPPRSPAPSPTRSPTPASSRRWARPACWARPSPRSTAASAPATSPTA